jgi:hypothetical protein
VRPWHFWRRAFWTRPAFFAAYAVIALAAFPFLVQAGVQAWIGGHALREHRICGPEVDGRCLERVTGQLRGPFTVRKSVNYSWDLRQGDRDIDSFEVGPRSSDRLRGSRLGDVTALTYDGQVMAVELPDGTEVHSTLEGARGVAQQLCLSVIALGATVGFFRYARKKRITTGGWWAVEGPAPDAGDLSVVLVVMPAVVAFVLMNFGAPWWLTPLGIVPFMLYVVSRMVRFSARGRHAATDI